MSQHGAKLARSPKTYFNFRVRGIGPEGAATSERSAEQVLVTPGLLRSGTTKATLSSSLRMRALTRPALAGQRGLCSSSSAWAPPRRNRRQLAAAPGADVVGPPDPVSNLRPVRYGSAFDVQAGAQCEGDTDKRKAHPYSLSEFSILTPDQDVPRHPFLSGMAGMLRLRQVPHSWYYRELVQRLEVAEMQSALRRVHSDAFHQRFWRDNNARYERDMYLFQTNPPVPPAQLAQQKTLALEDAPAPSSVPAGETPVRAEASASASPSEIGSAAPQRPPLPMSDFYQAWLGANTERHRAYNRALLTDLITGLRPAWNYAWLRIWTRTVKRAERTLGWGP